jgi:hypothetical protein
VAVRPSDDRDGSPGDAPGPNGLESPGGLDGSDGSVGPGPPDGSEGLESPGVPDGLTDRELHHALLLAGVMTLAVVALPRAEDGTGGEAWLGGLTAEYDKIFQAIGMIMAHLGVGAEEALARLRAHAFVRDRTVLEVSRDVVGRRVRFDETD